MRPSRVCSAGASRKSMRSATFAFAQYLRAIAVHSSFTSQATMRPSGGSASATLSALYPVNTPTSIVRRAPRSRASSAMNWPWSGDICMPAWGMPDVASRSSRCTGCSRAECPIRYS